VSASESLGRPDDREERSLRHTRRRVAGSAVLAVLLGLLVALLLMRPDRALRTAAGLTAHNLCAAAFTQGVDVDATFREFVHPMASVAAPFLHYHVDRSAQAVTASVLGFFSMRAVFTEGFGCRLVMDPRYRSPAPLAKAPHSAPDDFAPPSVAPTADAGVEATIDHLFTEPPGHHRLVKALVIVKDGRVVAERYAPGFGVDTPLLSYSVAKSFTNAFFGILVRQGRLRVDQSVGAAEWSHPGDPRSSISLDDLLRMQSGTSAVETGSGFDPASQMLYAHDDMAGYVARFKLQKPPRTEWRYTSANTLILDRVLGETVGGGASGFRAFAERELFQPSRMDGVTLEFDGTGVFVGASHVYAPARAYARFGWLYLNDGVAASGRRVLPEGWVAYSRRSTLGAPYGAGFWTNDGPSREAADLVRLGFPKDGFFASGNRGQRIYIVPSERLVMARFGYTTSPNFDVRADMAVLRAAIAAWKH
jgi:CubicO group peptidase (beta-lactamase class C family)